MKISRIGKVAEDFDVIALKNALVRNDSGEWGTEPTVESSVGVIRSTNFSNNGVLKFDDVAYRNLNPFKREAKALRAHDIVIERSGGSDSQPVGRVGFIDEKAATRELCFANFIQRISVDQEVVDAKFIYYCLQQMYEMGITSSMQFQTTGIRNLDYKFYLRSELPKPPTKDEQTAIANILSKVDETIQATENSIKAAEKLKKALMQNLLTGKMKPDGTWRREDEFYEDEKYGRVPKGWVLERLKKVVKLKNGKGNTTSNLSMEPTEEYNIPVYGGNGITGYFHSWLLNEPTLIIGRVGEYCGNVFRTSKYCWVTDNAMLVDYFRLESYSLGFFEHQIQALHLKQYSDSTGQPKITQGGVGAIHIIYPLDVKEQQKIFDKISSTQIVVNQKESKLLKLEKLKKALMQNLLTGKVRLSEELVERLNEKEEKELV